MFFVEVESCENCKDWHKNLGFESRQVWSKFSSDTEIHSRNGTLTADALAIKARESSFFEYLILDYVMILCKTDSGI